MNQVLESLIHRLAEYSTLDQPVFNPWRDVDPRYDMGPEAPGRRVENLHRFLAPRLSAARYVLVAEAPSYQGAKFTGIPMTSERILLGRHNKIDAADMIPDGVQRTSNPQARVSQSIQENGFTEPTATIVWGLFETLPLPFDRVVLWNIYPFHPYDPAQGPLSNRTPTATEIETGKLFIEPVRHLWPDAQLVAVGRKAAEALGEDCPYVRHPANGGANQFRRSLRELLGHA